MPLAVAEVLFVITGVAHLCAVLLLVIDLHRKRLRPAAAITDPVLCMAIGGVVAGFVGLDLTTVIVVTLLAAAGGVLVTWRAADFWPAGATAWSAMVASTAAGVVVAFSQLFKLNSSVVTVALVGIGLVLSVARTPSSLMQTFEAWEAGLRRRWHHSREPMTGWRPPADAPLVTIQVPTYAEPPDIVIGTLNALTKLEYPNFEVLVIDNNTKDERLWRPVQQHCERLGPRFRFLHVEGITGAKAGALNWARPHVDPRTELIGLIDADYQVTPRWLAETVGFFADPKLGFVQCPHAYRDFAHSPFARMVNTSYEWAHDTEMVSRNEHDTGITVGTMSLIRLETLDAAGGWAGWCQTEDSEFAIRVHAVGYGSRYLRSVHGRGLIPETLTELKKQRFRWTYGPGQELKAHLRLYLPAFLGGRPSRMSWQQRFRHGHYGLIVLMTGLTVFSVPISAALLVSLVAHHETPALDPLLLLPVAAALLARRVMRWLIYRAVIGRSFAEYVGGSVAMMAVKPTVSTAAFSVLIGKPALWRRTNKFRTNPGRFHWLRESRPEVMLGIACVAIVVAVPLILPAGPATYLLAAGFGWQAITYAAAPLVAWLGQRDLRRSALPAAPEDASYDDGQPVPVA
ncbi:glycosyltransferase [Fodinicola acaciae]|uniref:glycosyltransferase n=1 Tax=Fodinicola acaciae TaxID=2681555 RepID=UPI0013D45261|nr:glycosyltransferase [Fodinicola acaciae]